MPGEGLNKPELEDDLRDLFESLKGMTDPTAIDDKMIKGMAAAFDKFVRSGKVITAGSATAQQGTIT